MKRKIPPDAILLAAGLALLAILTLLRASIQEPPPSVPSTYDTGRAGYAALYDLLAQEGVRVRRFELPAGELPERGTALAVAGDDGISGVARTSKSLQALDAWVRAGNTLYVLGTVDSQAARILGVPPVHPTAKRGAAFTACAFARTLQHLPVDGDFAQGVRAECRNGRLAVLATGPDAPGEAIARGRGMVVFIATTTPFDNWHLTRAANARAAYALFGPAKTLAFDERIYGYAAGRTFWQVLPPPVHAAIWIAIAALLLALAGANIPFAPPYARPYAGERDSRSYIDSIANLLRRAHAHRDVVSRLSAAGEVLLRRAPNDDASRALLQRGRALRALSDPSPADVIAAGRWYAAVRKEFGC